jgi:uncharacterized membrane protein
MDFDEVVENVGKAIDVAGVAAILCGTAVATVLFVSGLLRNRDRRETYRTYRQGVGRSILLGLELLVAGDIVRTVAVEPTFTTVGVLAVIVLIRTFLSFTLELELAGHWPWQRHGPGHRE